ncbi:F-box domain [Arabidopsis suecica]|uniref:F-box domain n=1 Tax=Arabidopsis suecica TaxID=45249 RepID=A0A8T2B9D0_ARASU|nr:F-box domain [Arabidopsis suecica]
MIGLGLTSRLSSLLFPKYSTLISSTMYLPEELVVEILARVSAASLARLRRVSKGWNATINDEKFAKKRFLLRSHATVIMLIEHRVYLVSVNLHEVHNNMVKVKYQLSLKDPLSKSSEEVDIHDIFPCDGLLLCTTKDDRLVVWNPLTHETRWIQPRSTYKRLDYFALGKSSWNKYKILRMGQIGNIHPDSLEFEIYDFTSNSWRVVGKTTDWFIQPWQGRVMSVNGNAYWLACREGHGDFLQSFDFSTERFKRVSLPGDHHSYQVFGLSVTREEQQLCLLTQNNSVQSPYAWIEPAEEPRINVWIATKIESNGAASWIKFISFDLDNIQKRFCFLNAMNFLVDPENKVILCRGKIWVSKTFLNILGENKSIQVDHQDAKSVCSLLVNYVPTLVQIQQGSLV